MNPVWDWYRCVSWCQIHTLSNVSTSTFLGLLQGRGSAFSSTAKFSGGRALRDGFLRSRPSSDSDLRFRGVALSLFFCGARAGLARQLVDLSGMVWTMEAFVYQPEGWRTSAGLWWCSNPQRAWPAKRQQQQEDRWPLMQTGQFQ